LLGVLAAFTVGCAQKTSSPAAPDDLTASPRPTVDCPAPVLTQSFTGLSVRVVFPDPQATGGVHPLSVSCSPASGTAFPIGTTTVVCNVVDAASQAFPCSFTVRVLGPPRVSATRYLAFGDSITEGSAFDSYPSRLRPKLATRYPTQNLVVVNDGIAGETAAGGGRQRFAGQLDAIRPEAVLLMEGSNDLLGGTAGAAAAIDALTNMVRTARGRGIIVFLATIPPQRLGGPRDAVARLVPGYNNDVIALAQREGATLVDVYTAMGGNASLIGPDDLHPTSAGIEVIAQTFYNVIQQTLELPPE
jgi:lysophospholipase L1-like esterase